MDKKTNNDEMVMVIFFCGSIFPFLSSLVWMLWVIEFKPSFVEDYITYMFQMGS